MTHTPMIKKLALPALLLTLFFSGCAALEQQAVDSKEKSLAAAGFQARPVTADKLAAFNQLTPYKLQMRVHKGAVLYLFPDPKKNICYVGGPREYSAYQKIATAQELVAQQEMSQMEWTYWGPGYLGPGFAPMYFGGVPNRVW